jgi:hypothetical protein
MPTTPECGPCGPQWYINSVKHATGTLYDVDFHGSAVTRIVWDVVKDCVTYASGQVDPTSSTIQINLNGVPDDDYILTASCPFCVGFCQPFKFSVTHNGGGNEEEEEEEQPPTPNLDVDFVFLTNTTGYFDSDDFVDKIRELAPSNRVVRWCIRHDEYETSPGNYRTDKLAARKAQIDAIYEGLGLELPYYAVNFWAVRHDDKIEQFIPARDVVKFQSGKRATGDVVIGQSYGLGSFSSTAYRKVVADCGFQEDSTTWLIRAAKLRSVSTTYGMTLHAPKTTNRTGTFQTLPWMRFGISVFTDMALILLGVKLRHRLLFRPRIGALITTLG